MGTVRKKISAKKKIEVVAYAKKYSHRSAARKFGIHRKCVRVWRRSENNLRSLNGKSARRVGGGRKPKFPYLEERLLQHFRQQREKKLRVSRNQLKRKAVGFFEEMVAADEASDGNFTASDGWVTNFMRRNRISLRRITTTCQKTPEHYLQKIVDFIIEARSTIDKKSIAKSQIYSCDETAVWMDALNGSTLADVGAPEVSVRTTGHEKSRVTVMLCARANGSKCKPFILLQRKRPIPAVVKKYGGRASLQFCGTNWMNQALTSKFLDEIIGGTVFPTSRLLVWDKFSCHISEATKAHLKRLKLESVIVPGGCTKYVQAPDVCWNAPFKSRIRERYDE